jgi:hypothetical protein
MFNGFVNGSAEAVFLDEDPLRPYNLPSECLRDFRLYRHALSLSLRGLTDMVCPMKCRMTAGLPGHCVFLFHIFDC